MASARIDLSGDASKVRTVGPQHRCGRCGSMLVLLLVLAIAPGARASPTPPQRRPVPAKHRPRATEANKRPPDVRKGEAYDGRRRRKPATRALSAVPRLLLFLPRATWAVVSGVTLAALRWWEISGLGPALHRICFAWDGRLTVLPTVAWERGMLPVAGAALTTDLLFGKAHHAGLHAEAGAGHRDVWQARLELHPLGMPRPDSNHARRLHLRVAAGYVRRFDLPYFGTGYRRATASVTADDQERRLDTERFRAQAALEIRLWKSALLGVSVGVDWLRLRGVIEPDAGLDLNSALTRWHLGTDAFFTGGLSLGAGGAVGRLVPKPGLRARVSALARIGDQDSGRHLLITGDLESFVGLWGDYRRLGFRVHLAGVAPLDRRPVPLLALPALGGPHRMRGFQTGRFTGESVACLSAEYHLALHRRLWLSLFMDWGGAFREAFSKARWTAVDMGGGAGLALRIAAGSWMRLQVAGSRDGAAIFLGWGGVP